MSNGLAGGRGDPPRAAVSASTLGLLVGLMIHYFRVQPFIATLAAMFLARGLCYVISIESIPIDDALLRVHVAQADHGVPRHHRHHRPC